MPLQFASEEEEPAQVEEITIQEEQGYEGAEEEGKIVNQPSSKVDIIYLASNNGSTSQSI